MQGYISKETRISYAYRKNSPKGGKIRDLINFLLDETSLLFLIFTLRKRRKELN